MEDNFDDFVDFDEDFYYNEVPQPYFDEPLNFEPIENFATDEYCTTKCEFFDTCFGSKLRCLKIAFEKVLNTLPDREAIVLKMRCGYYNNGKCYSLEDVSRKLQVTRERIRQIEGKALRSLRRSECTHELMGRFDFDVFSISNPTFYSRLLIRALRNMSQDQELLYGFKVGIDFSVVDKERNSYKTLTQIKTDLNMKLSEIFELKSYIEYFSCHKDITLNQFLHKSYSEIPIVRFGNNVRYFEMLDTVKIMGYKFKDTSIELKAKRDLARLLSCYIIDESVYDETIVDLPLSTTLDLFENNILTLRDLISQIFSLKGSGHLFKTELDWYLIEKKLAFKYEYNDFSTTVVMTSSFVDYFINKVINLLIEKGSSVLNLIEELKAKKLIMADAIMYILSKYPNLFDDPIISTMNVPIEDLDLTVRSFSVLKRAGVDTLWDLLCCSKGDFVRFAHMGKKSMEEILEKVLAFGFALSDDGKISEQLLCANNDADIDR